MGFFHMEMLLQLVRPSDRNSMCRSWEHGGDGAIDASGFVASGLGQSIKSRNIKTFEPNDGKAQTIFNKYGILPPSGESSQWVWLFQLTFYLILMSRLTSKDISHYIRSHDLVLYCFKGSSCHFDANKIRAVNSKSTEIGRSGLYSNK